MLHSTYIYICHRVRLSVMMYEAVPAYCLTLLHRLVGRYRTVARASAIMHTRHGMGGSIGCLPLWSGPVSCQPAVEYRYFYVLFWVRLFGWMRRCFIRYSANPDVMFAPESADISRDPVSAEGNNPRETNSRKRQDSKRMEGRKYACSERGNREVETRSTSRIWCSLLRRQGFLRSNSVEWWEGGGTFMFCIQ